jgi:dephospho-CoA kinase
MSRAIFLGVTGLPGSGKGEVVRAVERYCDDRGIEFLHRSLSDVLREQARLRGLPVERQILHELGNELREKSGSGALASVVAAELKSHPLKGRTIVVIDAIRTPEEVHALREHFGDGFRMIAVEAPPAVLLNRIASRARPDELPGATTDASIATNLLALESGSGEPSFGLNVSAAIAVSDQVLTNDSTLSSLRNRVEMLVSDMIDGFISP